MYKFLEKKLKNIDEEPHVLLCYNKHSTEVFDATSREAVLSSSLSILKERIEFGFYAEPDEGYLDYKPELTEVEIEALPQSGLKKEAEKQVHRFKRLKGLKKKGFLGKRAKSH